MGSVDAVRVVRPSIVVFSLVRVFFGVDIVVSVVPISLVCFVVAVFNVVLTFVVGCVEAGVILAVLIVFVGLVEAENDFVCLRAVDLEFSEI